MDFTLRMYRRLIYSFVDIGYTFFTFEKWLRDPMDEVVILRHDVDKRPLDALTMAWLEHDIGLSSTYYFRTVGDGMGPDIIRRIHSMGHEVGYHYEDLAAAHKQYPGAADIYERAIASFSDNLERLRSLVPVKTISMHGSPMSPVDNRQLWERYNYRDFGITGEAYMDTDFSSVLYLTDTGRTWDNRRVSVRDRPRGSDAMTHGFRTTRQIIKAAYKKQVPNHMMITIHPQRWTNNPVMWVSELVTQNVKNIAKAFMVRR